MAEKMSLRSKLWKLAKILALVVGIVLVLIVSAFYILTDTVNDTPFYETQYFRKSCVMVDSLKKITTVSEDSIQAGFSKVSITPSLNNSADHFQEGKFVQVPLAGFGKREGKPATGIHDSLFIKAVAVKVGAKRAVFVGADLLIMPPNIIDTVTLVLEKQGIKREEVFYSATHTHSGIGAWVPGFLGKEFAGESNESVQKWLVQQISIAVVSAIADLRPARLGYGLFNAEKYTHNRLIDTLGVKNNDFCYLALQQIKGKKAVIGSFSAHSTTMSAANMEVSADYPGFWARKMEKTSVDLAVFFAGSVGSQSPVSEGEGFEKPRFIGESLADSLNIHLNSISLLDKTQLATVTVKMPLPEFQVRISRHRCLIPWAGSRLSTVPENSCVQALRLGDMIWITTPADFSGEYAVQIKNNLAVKGFKANVSSFNGSYLGYIIPGRYYYMDKYESQTMGWYGPAMGEYTVDLIRKISDLVTL